MSTLKNYDGSRNNNFTIIRLILAWLVLYGHSFAVSKTSLRDPLGTIFQGSVWIGEIAVNGFFAISGFLVIGSFIKRGILEYAISRVLRIFPALVACIVLSITFLGLTYSSLSFPEFLANEDTREYALNALAVIPMQYDLPSVFTDNKNTAINGSLWTLVVEVWCYMLLAAAGIFGLWKKRYIANISCAILLWIGINHYSIFPMIGNYESWQQAALYFLIGMFIYINRDRFYLHKYLAIIALCVLFLSFGETWFGYVFPFILAYIIFYSAYELPHLDIDKRIGDISYGVYIYAWPVQQIFVSLLPDQSPYIITLAATTVVIPLAYCSWIFIEKPSITKKNIVILWVKSIAKPLLGKSDQR